MTDRVQTQTRTMTFDVDGRDQGESGIPVVISTDAPVPMPDGPEILMHTRDAIDLSRAPLPMIAGHASGQINIGIVDALQPDGTKLRGMARFGSRPEAAGYRDDVLNKIIRSVSVGYARIIARVRGDGVLVTSRWMPTHVAMVAEPADINAGFFRSAVPEFKLETEDPPAQAAEPKGQEMTEAAASAGASAVQTPPANDGAMTEQLRIKTILNFARQHGIDDPTRDDWIGTGKTADEVAQKILDILHDRVKSAPKSVAQVGMTPKETQKYSLWRAIRAVADNNWKDAGFEAELSRAIATKMQRIPEASSFFVPFEVLQRPVEGDTGGRSFLVNGRRDLSVAAGGGGYLVETSNVGFIDMLRNRSVCFSMGVERMTGLVGNVNIPKQSAAATAYWLASETTQITESAQTFVQIPLSPKTVGAYTEISRLLLLQSSPGAEGIVTNDLSAVVAIGADLAILAGTGTSQPQGIIGTANLGALTSGTSFDYADMLEFQSKVAAGNVRPARGGYVTTPTVAALAMARVKFASTATPIWDGNIWDASVCGFPGMSSAQVPTGDMLFGDWSTVVVGEWGVLEIAVNPTANFQAGIIGIRAMYTMDVAVRHPVAFVLGTSMT